MLAYLLLAATEVAGLLLIPFSPFGIWIQLAAIGLFGWWTDFQPVGVIPLLVLFGIGLAVELIRFSLGANRIAEETRRRTGIAGLVGAGVGAIVGIPLPLVGSMFGALLGAAVATSIAALTVRPVDTGRLALVGQTFAMTLTTATGVAVAVFTLLILLR